MWTDIRNFLSALKAKDIKHNVPSVSETTGGLLFDLIESSNARKILELGTAHGYSTIWMASALEANRNRSENPEWGILTIEFSKPSFEAALESVKEVGFSSFVTHVFSDAVAYLPTIATERFDFVFIDAEKRSTAKLFDLVWPMLENGGTMVIDDVVKFRYKMEDFYQLLAERGIVHEIIMTDPDDGVMIIRKG